MALTRLPDEAIADALPGSINDRRAAMQRAEQERVAARRERLAAQTSLLHTPQERIIIWEQLHGVDLPRSVGHKLVPVIATQTKLTVAEVHDEQRRRADARAATGAPAGP